MVLVAGLDGQDIDDWEAILLASMVGEKHAHLGRPRLIGRRDRVDEDAVLVLFRLGNLDGPVALFPAQERHGEERATRFGLDEAVRFRERNAALSASSTVHPLVRGPDRLRPLALVLVERLFLESPYRGDVQVKLGPEGDRLLVGHHLEEIEVPAAVALVTLPDQGTDDMVVRVHVQRPVRHHDIRFHLVEPRGDRVPGLLVRRQRLMGIRKKLRLRARTLQAAVASSRRTSASGRSKNRRPPRNAVP